MIIFGKINLKWVKCKEVFASYLFGNCDSHLKDIGPFVYIVLVCEWKYEHKEIPQRPSGTYVTIFILSKVS